jgi:hypothetical protein
LANRKFVLFSFLKGVQAPLSRARVLGKDSHEVHHPTTAWALRQSPMLTTRRGASNGHSTQFHFFPAVENGLFKHNQLQWAIP